MNTLLQGKKVLVTGGSGFVGVNLIGRLLSLGARIRATTHLKPPVLVDPGIEYVGCDLLKMDDCRRITAGVEYVFMCAANTSGAAVIAATPLVHVTPNIVMNAQMLEAAHAAGVRKFVWLSSNAAYPPTGDRPAREDEMFVGDPYDAYFGAGWMKRYTEILCRLYSEKLRDKMPAVVVRPTNIYGPHDDFDFATSHVMAATIRKVVERHKPIRVWGTGDDVRDLIYIDDFIDALILAAERIETYDPVNIGFGSGHSVKEILNILLDLEDWRDAAVEFDATKPSMIPKRLVDTAKAERVLGFSAGTDLRTGIRKTVEWYKQHRGVRP